MTMLDAAIELIKERRSQTQCIVSQDLRTGHDQLFLKMAFKAKLEGKEFDGKKFNQMVNARKSYQYFKLN